MAVNFKVAGKANTTAWTVLKKLNIPDADIEWLRKSPLKVNLMSSALLFQVPSVDHSGVVAAYDVKFGLIELANLAKGNLASAKMSVLAHQTMVVVEEIKSKYGAYLDTLPPAPEQLPGTLGKLPPITKTPMTFSEAVKQASVATPGGAAMQHPAAVVQQVPNAGTLWPMFDMDKIKTADLVKLRDATHMYQPVHGSSPGSRYFMVGANSDLRIAARLKNGQLSVRIEGPNWSQYKHQIQSVGFSKLSKGDGYASVHFDVGDDIGLANKTLGAILTGLGIGLETPIPNLAVINK